MECLGGWDVIMCKIRYVIKKYKVVKMNLTKRKKTQIMIIIGLFIGFFIPELIHSRSIFSAILWGLAGCIIPIILFILKVDKLIKD